MNISMAIPTFKDPSTAADSVNEICLSLRITFDATIANNTANQTLPENYANATQANNKAAVLTNIAAETGNSDDYTVTQQKEASREAKQKRLSQAFDEKEDSIEAAPKKNRKTEKDFSNLAPLTNEAPEVLQTVQAIDNDKKMKNV